MKTYIAHYRYRGDKYPEDHFEEIAAKSKAEAKRIAKAREGGELTTWLRSVNLKTEQQ
jgi:hypothetical protein